MQNNFERGNDLRKALDDTFVTFAKQNPDLPVGISLAAIGAFTMNVVVSQIGIEQADRFFEESRKAVSLYRTQQQDANESGS